ncbi:hypothetical protein C8D88_10398 [Lentzea atacamensis]|uniref:Uncharacterized protein n=1 Tax=Lentzea atacamensis TaxID=531938 RepID=A0A316IBZ5_9PSEU|nr:hypothetical protein C8D88_10398 [Lentzea atacamensis]RAS71376.1 hypothetical protein C8D87_1011677 [Lentzea atacamensis]
MCQATRFACQAHFYEMAATVYGPKYTRTVVPL